MLSAETYASSVTVMFAGCLSPNSITDRLGRV